MPSPVLWHQEVVGSVQWDGLTPGLQRGKQEQQLDPPLWKHWSVSSKLRPTRVMGLTEQVATTQRQEKKQDNAGQRSRCWEVRVSFLETAIQLHM